MRKCVECGEVEKDWNFGNWKILQLREEVKENREKEKGKEMRRYFLGIRIGKY